MKSYDQKIYPNRGSDKLSLRHVKINVAESH